MSWLQGRYRSHLGRTTGQRWRSYGVGAGLIVLVTAPWILHPVTRRFVTTEDSILESGTALALLVLAIQLGRRVRLCRRRGEPLTPSAAALLAAVLFLGEELSWGVRWFGIRWYVRGPGAAPEDRGLRIDQIHDVVRLALDPSCYHPAAPWVLGGLVLAGLAVGLTLLVRYRLLRWLLATTGGYALLLGIVLLGASGLVEHYAEVTGIEKDIPHLLRYPEELLELLGACCFWIALAETEAAATRRAAPAAAAR
jgi:hypothetical protein